MINAKGNIPLITAPEFGSLVEFQAWIDTLAPGQVYFVHVSQSSCSAMGLPSYGRDFTIFKLSNIYVLVDSISYSVGSPRKQMKKQNIWDAEWTDFSQG